MPTNFNELSDKQLKWGYWWVLHRNGVRHLVEAFFGLLALLLCGYALWQVTDWLANRQAEEEAFRQMVNSRINTESYRQTNTPIPLEVGTPMAIPTISGLYDLVVEVKNSNVKWAIHELPYVFTVDGQTIQSSTYFLPMEQKYLIKLGVPFKSKPKQLSVSFENVKWQRIRNVGELPIPNMEISDEIIENITPSDASKPIGTRLKFNLTNDSPYSYWQVGLSVILSRTGSIQAVGQQTISNVISQSTRQVEFYWPETVITADNLIVRPEVNVLDSRVLK